MIVALNWTPISVIDNFNERSHILQFACHFSLERRNTLIWDRILGPIPDLVDTHVPDFIPVTVPVSELVMAERNEMEEMRVNMAAMQKSIEDMGNVIKTLVMLIPENPSPRRVPLNNERTNQLNEEDWYEEALQPVWQNVEIPSTAPRSPLNVEQPATDKYKTLQDQIEELKRTIIHEEEEQVGELSWWAIKKELEEATKTFGVQNSEQVVNVSKSWEGKIVTGEKEEDLWKPIGNEEVYEFGCGDDLWRSEYESESFEVEEDLWASETEVNHLTKSDRHYKPVHLVGEESPEAAVTKDAREEDLGDDEVLKQLKRTGANIPLGQLIMASHKHRQAILKALNKVPISINTSPEQMVAMLTPVKATNAITFTDKRLST
ncbi:hypothetical protein Vadar_029125 [Vaccinium darrowii]|uniref:Uncharacterized protein n=1 Tax=Vaccinium darrowii TaxID=229202 RepID=A0ACB7ZG54_9ERIC|nr:hypothetical protein Vadar_029125 [Vaccinium darrowii]